MSNQAKFTVKNVLPDGSTNYMLSSYVAYHPVGYGGKDVIWIDGGNGDRVPLHEGSVYIMNEHGKTVDQHRFHCSVEPTSITEPA